jgi:3-oxoacyl-[acyl-carrier-protein] synthase-3
MHTNRALLGAGIHKKTALFIAERYSMRIDYSDRATACLFGDGSAGAILEAGDGHSGLEIIDTFITSAPSKFDTVRIPVGGTFWQNGSAVQKFAITKTIHGAKEMMERHDLSPEKIDYFIGHQANLRMLQSVARKLGLNDQQHLFNVNQFGNQGAAGAPSVLSMNWDRFKTGDLILISVVGSGLTWGSALLRKT